MIPLTLGDYGFDKNSFIEGGNNVVTPGYKLNKDGSRSGQTVMLKIFLGENAHDAYLKHIMLLEANTTQNWEHLTEVIDYSDGEIVVGDYKGYVVALER